MTNNEAIEILNTMLEDGRYLGNGTHIPLEVLETFNKAREALKNQKVGHWIDDEFGSKCSRCDIHTHLDKFERPMKFRYCSMCGAKMIEQQKSEDNNETD